MLATAETAHSKLAVGPSPRWASARLSSTRVARLSQGCSSRRTISSPTRAVERQCTRRRSSPWRYSRVAASSSPCTATDRARRLAGTRVLARQPYRRQRRAPGGSRSGGRRTGRSGSARTARTGRSAVPPADRPRTGRARRRGPCRPPSWPGAAPSRSRTSRGRLPSAYGSRSSSSRVPVGRPDRFCRRSTTRALAPTGVRCGCRARVQASRYRVRPTYHAASSGRAATRTATRSRSFSPNTRASTAIAPAEARNDLPRVVRPRRPSRTSASPAVRVGRRRAAASGGCRTASAAGRWAAAAGAPGRRRPRRWCAGTAAPRRSG